MALLVTGVLVDFAVEHFVALLDGGLTDGVGQVAFGGYELVGNGATYCNDPLPLDCRKDVLEVIGRFK